AILAPAAPPVNQLLGPAAAVGTTDPPGGKDDAAPAAKAVTWYKRSGLGLTALCVTVCPRREQAGCISGK
ncbi:MAG: hypothetical protein LC772_10905, partial [Chloroflexi bacterium]|nr:hypothetical protein [Chloroflexota bacterium]